MATDNNRPLKDWLQVFAHSPQLRETLYQTRVEKMWEDMMGPVVMKYTGKIKLEGKVQIIQVNSASLKSELHIMRETILSKVNEQLGEDYVKEVRVI